MTRAQADTAKRIPLIYKLVSQLRYRCRPVVRDWMLSHWGWNSMDQRKTLEPTNQAALKFHLQFLQTVKCPYFLVGEVEFADAG